MIFTSEIIYNMCDDTSGQFLSVFLNEANLKIRQELETGIKGMDRLW